MIERILAYLFPPKLPGKITDWASPEACAIAEQGWAGNVRRKYRDGIERYFEENRDIPKN